MTGSREGAPGALGFQELDELGGGFCLHEAVAGFLFLHGARERADADEVIADEGLGGADDEDQMNGIGAALEPHALDASARGEDDLVHAIRPSVGKCDAIADDGGIDFFAAEQRLMETVQIMHTGIRRKKVHQLAERASLGVVLQIESDLFF